MGKMPLTGMDRYGQYSNSVRFDDGGVQWSQSHDYASSLLEPQRACCIPGTMRTRQLHKALGKLLIESSWDLWMSKYREEQRQKRLMSAAMNRMLKLAMSQAWEQWQSWYLEQKENLVKMQHIMNRMLNRKLSKAWEQWQSWYEDLMRQRDLAEKALKLMQNMTLGAAFRTWRLGNEESSQPVSPESAKGDGGWSKLEYANTSRVGYQMYTESL